MWFYKRKIVFLFFLVFILINLCYFSFAICNNDISVENIVDSKTKLNGHIVNISINNINGIYNSDDNTFYFSINNSLDTHVIDIKVNSSIGMKYKILDDNIYRFIDSKLLVYNDKYYQIYNISFIPISIISLRTNPKINKQNYYNYYKNDFFSSNVLDDTLDENILITVNTSNNYKGFNSFSYNISGSYHVRGASSLIFDKKSYKINLNKKDSILNMIYSKDWVLDAVYNDSSKVRNKLSSDLWNKINDNQVQQNDLDSQFVELYIDDEYMGLYVLKNSITKSMLNLGEEGILIKPFTDFNDYMRIKLINGDYTFVNNSFLNFEVKHYTNYDDINKFITMLKDIVINDYDDTSIMRNYDLNNYVNYKVLISFIMGVDNISKNTYISMNDSDDKMLITPWDMDLTFGNNWDSNVFNGESFYADSFSNKQWLDENVLSYNSIELNYMIKQRYWELRKDVITMNTINNYLDNYKKILVDSGAAKRDSLKWYRYDIEEEIELIRTWCYNRIQFLDQYFKL